MNRDELMSEIKAAGASSASEQERKEILNLITQPAMQRALNSLLVQSDEALVHLSNADLTTEDGIKIAIRIQTRAKTLASFVEELVEFATTEIKENTNGNPKQ